MNTKKSLEVLGRLSDEVFQTASVGMTEIQARRATLLKKGLGPSEIAREEGVCRGSVSLSIEAATTKARLVIRSQAEIESDWREQRRLGLA